jgi:hypothetical protein
VSKKQSITIITPAQARETFGSQVMTPDGLLWRGNVRMACIGDIAWAI